MWAFTSYFLHFASLFVMSSPLPQGIERDTINHEEWLLSDTLNLRLEGPFYEVSFFMDDITFLTSGGEGLWLVPMDQPDLSNKRPLFTNDLYPYPPAGMTFSADNLSSYATRHVEIWGTIRMEKIFGMSVDSSTTSGLHQLNFTNDSSRYLHPATSLHDSLMVFSSDRLSTNGGLDLFVTRLSSKGWSTPVNLGPSINSNGHERYPFLDRNNNLWFSSTGHSGYGSYDIYVCKFNGQEWERPQNLGSSFNTTMDEIGFSIHPSDQVALFTRRSSREGIAIKTSLKKSSLELSLILQSLADPPAEPVSKTTLPPEPEPADLPETMNEQPVTDQQYVLPDPDKLVFRVQIVSSEKANSTPSVLIDGTQHSTFEYYYKGAYRITVGEFETVQAANSFRLQCKNAGFNQAFVAAFRGVERETDPSVFKK
jgi:hypothetical protein